MIRLLLIILTLTSSSPVFGLVIEFKKTAEVSDVSVTLGDIASFDKESDLSRALASQYITQSPSAGQSLTIRTQAVIHHFAKNLNSTEPLNWQGSQTVQITRLAQEVSSSDILNVIENYLQKEITDYPKAKFHFSPTAQPLPLLLPTGKLTWEVIPSDPDIIGSSRFSIIISVDGRVRKNISVRGKLEVMAKVVVAQVNIKKGSILRPQHLKYATRDISSAKSPCLDPRNILGKKITASIKAGHPISTKFVETPPLIRKGELVHMVVKRGSLTLTAKGIARNDGTANETIRVQNTGSKKLVYCRVAGPGVVEVLL